MVETKKESKVEAEKLGISGFTLSISGLILILFNPIAGIIFSFVGVVFCIIQRKKNKTTLAKVGMIIGIVGVAVNLTYILVAFYWIFPYLQQKGLY